jgi:hypothetical protein
LGGAGLHTLTVTPGFTCAWSVCISFWAADSDDFELDFDSAGEGALEDLGVWCVLLCGEGGCAGVCPRIAAAAAVALVRG